MHLRQLACAFITVAATLPVLADTPAETLEALVAAENRDPAAWQAVADAADAAGDTATAGAAREQLAEIDRQRFPCRHQPHFQDFDFWIGEWDVHVQGGQLAGRNSIRPAERGCVLIEEWSSATGGTGRSINYYDAAAGEWVQVWNDASGSQIDIRGGLTDEGMLLEGEIHYVGNGTTAPFRGLWTPLPDGRVRQFFEQSNDGGESWTPWFEGFYSRRDANEGS